MWEKSGISQLFASCLTLCTCALAIACGGADDGSGATAGVLSQAPHCPTDSDALKIEGTIAGAAITDSRTANINAGYENLSGGRFYSPLSSFSPLESNQLGLTVEWPGSLFNGQTTAISGGTLTLPATHPEAGGKYCVSAGQVGFVDGGSEDGAFKFAITEVKAGADCSGAATAVDLRGCYQ
jgi:hypothetical protein